MPSPSALCHNRGMTLIEVSIALGLMMVLSLGIAGLMNYQSNSIADIRATQAIEESSIEMKNALVHSATCDYNLNTDKKTAKNFSTLKIDSTDLAGQSIAINQMNFKNGDIMIKSGEAIRGLPGSKVSGISLDDIREVDPRKAFVATLNVSVEKPGGLVKTGVQMIKRSIAMALKTEGTDPADLTIISCNGSNSDVDMNQLAELFCTSAGGTWDSSATPKCMITPPAPPPPAPTPSPTPSSVWSCTCQVGSVANWTTSGCSIVSSDGRTWACSTDKTGSACFSGKYQWKCSPPPPAPAPTTICSGEIISCKIATCSGEAIVESKCESSVRYLRNRHSVFSKDTGWVAGSTLSSNVGMCGKTNIFVTSSWQNDSVLLGSLIEGSSYKVSSNCAAVATAP